MAQNKTTGEKAKIDYTFSQTVKEEIAVLLVEATKPEVTAFLAGFFKQSGTLIFSHGQRGLDVQTANALVARKVYQEIKRHYPYVQVEIIVRRMVKLKKQNMYVLRIFDSSQTFLAETAFFDAEGFSFQVPVSYRQGNLLHYYVQGLFLGRGSINNLQQANYHLEIAFTNKMYALDVRDCLLAYAIVFKYIKRRNAFILYLKDSTMIGDFLAFIKASHARFAFEDVRISRDMMNSMNRLINSEVANEQKIIKASAKQIASIEVLEAKIGLDQFSEREQLIAHARRAYPEASLAELSELLFKDNKLQISKSGLNHTFRKFARMAQQYEREKEKK